MGASEAQHGRKAPHKTGFLPAIDDHSLVREGFRHILVMESLTVRTTPDGATALTRLCEHARGIQALSLDLVLPNLLGQARFPASPRSLCRGITTSCVLPSSPRATLSRRALRNVGHGMGLPSFICDFLGAPLRSRLSDSLLYGILDRQESER